jgi:hypothetical protein
MHHEFMIVVVNVAPKSLGFVTMQGPLLLIALLLAITVAASAASLNANVREDDHGYG